MSAVSTNDLITRLKKGKPISVILLLGDEPYLRDLCRAQLIDQYVAEAAAGGDCAAGVAASTPSTKAPAAVGPNRRRITECRPMPGS